jgi:hypothetical protein
MESEMINKLKYHLENTPIEKLEEEWLSIIKLDISSMPVDEYLYFFNRFGKPKIPIEFFLNDQPILTPEFPGVFFYLYLPHERCKKSFVSS